MTKRHDNSRQNGFTLIELAIAIIIIGILMAAALSTYQIYIKRHQVDVTNENLKNAQNQLAAFEAKYGYLPCPADPAAAVPVATKCDQPATVTAAMGRVAGLNPGGGMPLQSVRIGVLPLSVDVGGPDMVQFAAGDKVVDGWRNRLSYAVVEQMATSPAASSAAGNDGTVEISTLAGAIHKSRYIIFSHGPDGVGAYNFTGALALPCVAGASIDSENCNNDQKFVNIDRLTEARSTSGDANNYDDFAVDSTITSTSCPPGGVAVGVSSTGAPMCSQAITCPMGQYFAALKPDGTPDCRVMPTCPSGRYLSGIDAAGGAICNTIAACGPGGVLQGFDPVSGAPKCVTDCPYGYVLQGFGSGGTASCVPVAKSCGAGSVVQSVDSNGSPICEVLPPNVSNKTCPAGQSIQGFDGSGNPTCVPNAVAARDMGWYFDYGQRGRRQMYYWSDISQGNNPPPSDRLYVCGVAHKANCDSYSSDDACLSVRYCSFD